MGSTLVCSFKSDVGSNDLYYCRCSGGAAALGYTLALYLLTFVLAFTKKQFASAALLNRLMIVGCACSDTNPSSGATEPAWVLILANLGFFFVAALMCHGQLANDRPSVTHLAEYYLWIAVGGALGSVFNVLIAPKLFTSILEYPLAIVIACMLQRSEPRDSVRLTTRRVVLECQIITWISFTPVGLYVLTVSLAILVQSSRLRTSSSIIKAVHRSRCSVNNH